MSPFKAIFHSKEGFFCSDCGQSSAPVGWGAKVIFLGYFLLFIEVEPGSRWMGWIFYVVLTAAFVVLAEWVAGPRIVKLRPIHARNQEIISLNLSGQETDTPTPTGR